jgi:hypothetical protein
MEDERKTLTSWWKAGSETFDLMFSFAEPKDTIIQYHHHHLQLHGQDLGDIKEVSGTSSSRINEGQR